MKTALVTIAIGDEYRSIAEVTHPILRGYAERIGADFIDINQRSISQTTPHFEKFQVFNLLNKYHRILFIDTDILIRSDCPNLFEIVPEDKLGAFNEGAFAERAGAMQLAQTQYNIKLDKLDGVYYNTGVLVISRKHKPLFKKPIAEISNFYEQSYLNLLIAKYKISVYPLEYKYNRMTVMDNYTGESRLASYIVHYAGCPNTSMMRELMLVDLVHWREDGPEFVYRRNINVQVHGGLGDEVCAEPVLRYLIETAYPDANVHVITWYPRIFMHLPVPIYKMGKFRKPFDIPFYEIHTMAKHGCPSWLFVSPNLMHTTDYSSIMCLRGTIPNMSKRINLQILPEDLEEVHRIIPKSDWPHTVLVHPGRGWASKTFPVEWWNQIISDLATHCQVILIGKHISDEQGIVDVTVPDGVINAVNLLSLGGIIAMISKARVLLSNDSAPIHLAGAFDNHIVLIPTCKRPDHVLPYRHGRQDYNTVALYKKLVCGAIDSTPTMVHGQTIDKVPGDIMDYLPDPDIVVKEVLRRLTLGTHPTNI